eukprot:TRINITY_DN14495_c0_g1_i2.p1 TRINITY_DN14495_c0_g1~~TRINITY_DN14495_c0_g1_i2.p1  ORF type:complete len:507 (-),score=75.93 TRINITY_DN14495_c0_g1_i2:122-1606(-)
MPGAVMDEEIRPCLQSEGDQSTAVLYKQKPCKACKLSACLSVVVALLVYLSVRVSQHADSTVQANEEFLSPVQVKSSSAESFGWTPDAANPLESPTSANIEDIIELQEISSVLEPQDCTGNTESSYKPLQSIRNGGGYDIKSLTVSTGHYVQEFTVNEPITELNGCGTSPLDSYIYCCVQDVSGDDTSQYIARVGQEKASAVGVGGIEFVAQIPASSSKYNAAAFDLAGRFFFSNFGDLGVSKLYLVTGLESLQGFTSSADPGIADRTGLTFFQDPCFGKAGDLGWWAGDCGTQSSEDYLFWIRDFPATSGQASAVKVTSDDPTQWQCYNFDTTGFTPGVAGDWGAAWSYVQFAYFASNAGHGVWTFDVCDIQAATSTFTIEVFRVGSSDTTSNNDGMNCINVSSPYENATTTMTNTTTSTATTSTTITSTMTRTMTTKRSDWELGVGIGLGLGVPVALGLGVGLGEGLQTSTTITSTSTLIPDDWRGLQHPLQ